jgi:3-hydroxyacyl-[acyl-carrier-protein] dehydratase
MRFELVDHVVEQSPERLIAVKVLSAAEEYLQDHFEGFPVMPGVMMLEALVQAGRKLVEARGGSADGPWVVQQVRNIRYAAMVRPGQALRLEVTLRDADDTAGVYQLQGVGVVDDQQAVQGRFTLVAARSLAAA